MVADRRGAVGGRRYRVARWVSGAVVVLAGVCSIVAQDQGGQGRQPAPTTPATGERTASYRAPSTSPGNGASPDRRQQLDRIEAQLKDLQGTLLELKKNRAGGNGATGNGTSPVSSEAGLVLDSRWVGALTWRSVGPANMGGRIVDLAVYEADPTTYYVGTASGGLLKTTNNGITFTHQFDKESTVSLGAVAVAQTDPNIVWVGTGENNPRNSVSYGDGVYKSVDGGKTWKNMGLNKTFQIGDIQIHPKNPNVVYVGALGRLYGPNPERGLYKTTNGGESWEHVLFVDDKTGVIEIQMHPAEPDTLLVATWERMRDGYDSHPGSPMPEGYDSYDPIRKWGPGSGIHKTTDGGRSWKKLTKGLPSSSMGRIGMDYYRKNPNVIFAIIDCEKIGMGLPPRSGAGVYVDVVPQEIEGGGGIKLMVVRENGPSAKAGLLVDDIVQAIDDKPITRVEQLAEEIRSKRVGDRVKYKILRGDKTVEIFVVLERVPESPGSGGSSGVFLGVAGEDVEGGVKVNAVAAETPAALAGIENDDVIQAIDGKDVTSNAQMLEEIRSRRAGDKIKIKVLRDGQSREVEVTLVDRPEGRFGGRGGGGGGRGGRGGGGGGAVASGPYIGITGEDVDEGVRLTRVLETGPAQQAGLKAGEVIQTVGGKAVGSYQQLLEEVRTRRVGEKLAMTVLSEGKSRPVEVTVAQRPQFTGGGAGTRPTSRPVATRPSSAMYGGQMENVQDDQGPNGHEYGGVYRSADGGETWTRLNSVNPRPMYFSVVKVDPTDEKYLYVLGINMYRSKDGGKTFRGDASRGVHADQHALWINPKDGRHMIVGTDGGHYVSHDRADTWDHLNTMAIAQFYHVAICPHQPYHITGGLQDNGTWAGPSASLAGSGPINEDWISVGGGDGFVCRVDPEDPHLVYGESQNGAMFRRNLRTGERASIRPVRPDGAPPYRFNWNTPFILSNHNPRIFYAAGNYVFRSVNRGDNLQPISPEITLTKWGSATAVVESPRNPDVLYAGTDDGALWATRDGGKNWANITANLGLPAPRWVSTIEASRFAEGRAYIVLDGHRSDDDEPYAFVTEDFGKTWKSIRANLPWGSTRVLREDLKNANVLYLGTEFGAWCSIDRGRHWNKMGSNLPTVAVHEFALHPANGEIVAATHGRSLWVMDVSPLRQIKAENLANKPALYEPAAAVRWRAEPRRGGTNRRFVGTNPPRGAQIYYSLPESAQTASLKVVDINGATLREFPVRKDAGLHKVTWDLRTTPGRATTPTTRPTGGGASETGGATVARAETRGGGGGGGGGGGEGGRGRGRVTAATVQPGAYRVILTVNDTPIAHTLKVEADPVVAESVYAEDVAEEEGEEEEEKGHGQDKDGEIDREAVGGGEDIGD